MPLAQGAEPGPAAPSAVVAAYRVCEGLPVVGGLFGRVRREGAALLHAIVGAVLDDVDIDAIVARIDIDAIAARIDIDAIVARLDLIGLADKVIDGVDLPAIIRDSTSSVTAEVMTDVRTQGERADDMVSGFVDRMLGRGQGRR